MATFLAVGRVPGDGFHDFRDAYYRVMISDSDFKRAVKRGEKEERKGKERGRKRGGNRIYVFASFASWIAPNRPK